ncbi:hypothetical protein HpMS107_43120 [Helicobacter pylori]
MFARQWQVLGHARKNLGSHQFGLAIEAQVSKRHGKFVAAHACHHIAGPHRPANAVGDGPQQVIPHGMAERFIDVFEMVEIEQQQRHTTATTARFREQYFASLMQFRPVWQPRQRIVLCHVADIGIRKRRLLARFLALTPKTACEPSRQHDRSRRE